MKRKIALGLLFIVAIIYSIHIYQTWESDVVSDLPGKIYYTKRIDGVLQLFTSNANLTNEKLIYAHSGEENNNIGEFYYDKDINSIYFIAMKDGKWSLFSIDTKRKNPTFIQIFDGEWKDFLNYYVGTRYKNMEIINRQGSLYLMKNGKEELLKKFIGFYDSKFNSGHTPIGFSPDGKFIIYHSSEHLTPFGTLIEGMFDKDYHIGQNYIMELETKKIEKYPALYSLQWIME